MDPGSKFDGAFAATVRPKLSRIARRLTGNMADQEDLVQTAFLIGLEKLPLEAMESNPAAWLIRAMKNRFIDDQRRKKNRQVDPSVDVINDIPMKPQDDMTPRWAAVTSESLSRAIATLPMEYRLCYELHAQGKKYREIAAHLRIPLNTVGTRLRKARDLLRACLLQEDGSV